MYLRSHFCHHLHCNVTDMRTCLALMSSRQHGWRFEKLRPTFKKWVRINHPPQVRSPLVKLHPESNKIIYVCNGKISPRQSAVYEQHAKHFIKKDSALETPVLAFVKGGSGVLLETLSMDDVEQLESLVPEIQRAFKECGAKNLEGTEHRHLDYNN